jgi:uncharacterized protein YbaP (TraB family)
MVKKLLFVLSFLIFADAHAANDKAFVWEVSSDTTTVYLMGSIHFADKSFYPLRPEIEQAFDRSSYLVVELDINKAGDDTYSQLLAQNGIFKDGATIKDEISEETWQQLQQRLQQLNISYDAVKNYKPGVIVLTLSAVQVMQMGFDPALGIDAYFLAKASQQENPKQVIELETLEQQLNLFIDTPDGELLLKESLYSLDEGEVLMADMVRFWKQGDITQMNKLLFEDALNDNPAFAKIYDKLFYDRNDQMALKIETMLRQKTQQKNYFFVVVGSGHLIGDKGIVNALQEKGYQVRRL